MPASGSESSGGGKTTARMRDPAREAARVLRDGGRLSS